MGHKSAYGIVKSLKDTGEGQNSGDSPCAGHIAGEVLHSASRAAQARYRDESQRTLLPGSPSASLSALPCSRLSEAASFEEPSCKAILPTT